MSKNGMSTMLDSACLANTMLADFNVAKDTRPSMVVFELSIGLFFCVVDQSTIH